MPLKFWDEAFLMATYLINRIPSRVLDFSTPLTRLFGEKLNYNFLCVGCACWPNLHPDNTNLSSDLNYVVFSYTNKHKGYKCLDIYTGRVYISRDVIFEEAIFPFTHLHSSAGA